MASMQNAYRSLYVNQTQATKSMRNLSSGYRINSAADDAAGLAISERMRSQIRGLDKATQNATNAVSLVQTAEGGLNSTSSVLQRMRELAVQASNGTYSDADRELLNKEFQQLQGQLDQTASSTHYNGIKLLDGSLGGKAGAPGLSELGVADITAGAGNSYTGDAKFNISVENGVTSITAQFGGETITNQLAAGDTSTTFTTAGGDTIQMDFSSVSALKAGTISGVGLTAGQTGVDLSGATGTRADSGLTFQIGANGGADQRVSMNIGDMSSMGLGLSGINIGSVADANKAIDAITAAQDKVSSTRSGLGSMQNRLEHTVNNLVVTTENMYASESRIRDADMAKEIMEYTQRSIMMQASQAMLAQSMNMNRSYMLGLLMR